METRAIAALISQARANINRFLVRELEQLVARASISVIKNKNISEPFRPSLVCRCATQPALGIKGLSPSHGGILAQLFANGRMTMTALATAVRRDKSTVTTLVGKLVTLGYVRKEHCENDQRATYVSLTAKGEALKSAFEEISDRLLDRLWNGINENEQKEMVRMVKKIISNFSAPNLNG